MHSCFSCLLTHEVRSGPRSERQGWSAVPWMRRLVFSPVGLSVCLAPTLGEAWSSRMVYNYHFKREGEIRTRSTEYGEPRSRFPVIAVLRRSFPVAAPTRTGLAVGPGPPSGRGWGWGGERYFSTVLIPRTHHSERTPLPPCVAASSPRPGVCGSHQVPPLSPPLPQPSSAKTHAGYAVTPAGREALGAKACSGSRKRRPRFFGRIHCSCTHMYTTYTTHPRSPIPCPRLFGKVGVCPLFGFKSTPLPTLPVPHLSWADLHTPLLLCPGWSNRSLPHNRLSISTLPHPSSR